MKSDELRFRHIGLSSDGRVIFCEMDNGKTYSMPVTALERAEDWDGNAKPKAAGIIHDARAAFVKFDNGVKIDFPSDFVVGFCEPSHLAYKHNGRSMSGVGGRIREIRQSRHLTLDALAAKCGIAKPNLSRLENDKVTPTFETLKTIAAALSTQPVLLVADRRSEHAWTWTRHQFEQWKLDLRSKPGSAAAPVHSKELVNIFLKKWPECEFARKKLLEHAGLARHVAIANRDSDLAECLLDAGKWAQEKLAVGS